MARFESLVETQLALKKAELRRQVEMEVTRARLLSLQKEKQDELLRLSQQRTQLCAKLEAARELTQQWVRAPRGPTHCASQGIEVPETVLATTPQNNLGAPVRQI